MVLNDGAQTSRAARKSARPGHNTHAAGCPAESGGGRYVEVPMRFDIMSMNDLSYGLPISLEHCVNILQSVPQ